MAVHVPLLALTPMLPASLCTLNPLQAVFGLERAVDMTIAKRVPAIAYATTVAIRFVNNVVGEQRHAPCSATAAAAADEMTRSLMRLGWGSSFC
jgi:hypothetical protein